MEKCAIISSILFQFWRSRTLERKDRDQKNLISSWKEDSRTGRKGKGGIIQINFCQLRKEDALQLTSIWLWMYFRCLLTGGEQVLDDYLFEQENLIYCMLKQFDLEVNIWCIKYSWAPCPSKLQWSYLAAISAFLHLFSI